MSWADEMETAVVNAVMGVFERGRKLDPLSNDKPLRIGVTGPSDGLTKAQWHTIRTILYGAKIGRDEAWVGCMDRKGAEAEIMEIATALGYKIAGFPGAEERADIVYTAVYADDISFWADHRISATALYRTGNTGATVIQPDGTWEHIPAKEPK